jgi:hypothetical protein
MTVKIQVRADFQSIDRLGYHTGDRYLLELFQLRDNSRVAVKRVPEGDGVIIYDNTIEFLKEWDNIVEWREWETEWSGGKE